MSENWFMKTPCIHCPFRRDVKPFLTPSRGVELAMHATNQYNTFPCHKTTVSDEEFGGDGEELIAVDTSKECAGFMTLQISECETKPPEGFEPAFDMVYYDTWEMIEAYEQ